MRKNPWFVYMILLLGIFVALEANAFTTPALPYISESFGISPGNSGLLSLLASAAAIALAPLFGRLGDQLGRKNLIVWGLGIFAVAQIIKILTPIVELFIFGSLLQGIGYALIFPNVFAYIPELFPENKRGKAIGLFMLFTYIATGTGGIIAGLLIDTWGWHSVFVLSASFAVIGLVLVTVFVPKSVRGKQAALDYKGATLFMVAITLFVGLPLILTNLGPVMLAIGAAVLAGILVVFFGMQKKAAYPVMDLKLLKNKGIYIPAILIAFQNFMMLSILMSLTFMTAENPNATALQVGLITTVLFSSAALLSPTIGSLLDRFNPVYLVFVALAFGMAGIILYMGVEMSSTTAYILTVMVFVGICSSFLNASLMKIILLYTPEDKKGVGTGTFSLFKDLGLPVGSTLGLVIYGAVMASSFDASIQEQANALSLTVEQTSQLIISETEGVPVELAAVLTPLNTDASVILLQAKEQSVASTFNVLGTINFIIFIGLIIVSFGLLRLKSVSAIKEKLIDPQLQSSRPEV